MLYTDIRYRKKKEILLASYSARKKRIKLRTAINQEISIYLSVCYKYIINCCVAKKKDKRNTKKENVEASKFFFEMLQIK